MVTCSGIIPLLADNDHTKVIIAASALVSLGTETAAREMIEGNITKYLLGMLKSENHVIVNVCLKLIINLSYWEFAREVMLKEGIPEATCTIINLETRLLRGKSRIFIGGLNKGTRHGDINILVLLAQRNFTSSKQGVDLFLSHIGDGVLDVMTYVLQSGFESGGVDVPEMTAESAIYHIFPNLGMSKVAIEKFEKCNPSIWEVAKTGMEKCKEGMDARRGACLRALFAFIKNTGISMSEGGESNAELLGNKMTGADLQFVMSDIIKLIIPKNPTFRPNEAEKLKTIGIVYNQPEGQVERPAVDNETLIASLEVLLGCACSRMGREYLRSIGAYAVLRELDNGFIPHEDEEPLRALIDLMIGDEETTPIPTSSTPLTMITTNDTLPQVPTGLD